MSEDKKEVNLSIEERIQPDEIMAKAERQMNKTPIEERVISRENQFVINTFCHIRKLLGTENLADNTNLNNVTDSFLSLIYGSEYENDDNIEEALKVSYRYRFGMEYDNLLSYFVDEQGLKDEEGDDFNRKYNKNGLVINNVVLAGYIFMCLQLKDGVFIREYKTKLLEKDNPYISHPVKLNFWGLSKHLWKLNGLYYPWFELIDIMYYKGLSKIDSLTKELKKLNSKKNYDAEREKRVRTLETEKLSFEMVLKNGLKALNVLLTQQKSSYRVVSLAEFSKYGKQEVAKLKVALCLHVIKDESKKWGEEADKNLYGRMKNFEIRLRINEIESKMAELYPIHRDEGELVDDVVTKDKKAFVEKYLGLLESTLGISI